MPESVQQILMASKKLIKRTLRLKTVIADQISILSSKLVQPVSRIDQTAAVYLTFDDGPDPEYTAKIVKILDQRGHKATFFFLGRNAEKFPDLVRQIHATGHAIGSHSDRHLKQWETSSLALLRDYFVGHRIIESIVGQKTHLFRPPYGHFDIRSVVFALVRRVKVYLWNCDSKDWPESATKESILSEIKGSDPKSGSIILLHDAIYDNPEAADRTNTVSALDEILDYLEARGLRSEALR